MKKIAVILFTVSAALAGCHHKKADTTTTAPAAGSGSAAPAAGSGDAGGAPAGGSAM